MKFWSRFLLIWVIVTLLAVTPAASTRSLANSQSQQADIARQKARGMLAKLTPEERVGQLFLVTFQGTTFDETSQIFDLIARHHIGGVVLLRANDNFNAGDTGLEQIYGLNGLLQQSKFKASQRPVTKPNTGVSFNPQYIPLLIGISQDGDDYPNNQILSGLTPLPNLMSIGATWNSSLAEQVGAVMGKELAALGFNLYFGPSLNVLDSPNNSSADDLGVRTFGGDPYWVGKMGQAYISGLHQGSAGRMMVISKDFPGRGGADRSPNDEIATVRKTLDQLKKVDMSPFFDAAGNSTDTQAVTDGLLVSHIRYQALQGTIRATTRPISSDAAALEQVLKQQPLTQWRENGGVLISDNLGSPAIRKFYDPTGTAFDARTAAREAFFAGNDLLYLDHFVATNDPDEYTTVIRTLDFFAQKYRDDAAFAQRVDASVERILTLKYRLYPDFNLDRVIPSDTGLAAIGSSQAVTFEVARRSVALINPETADLANILPRGPEPRDRILFLTDVQTGRQCSNCSDQAALAVNALQNVVVRLYGPRTGGQVSQNLMSSYSFMDLWKMLNGIVPNQPSATPTQPTFENDLKLADWVVVSVLKPNPSQPESSAFKRLLSDRPDLLRNKKVVVFAFNAPYYLDATDISKLSAYYALYSKTAPFVDVAARILFQEMVPSAALPVSVQGIGYDVALATSPDPAQVVPLSIDSCTPVVSPTNATQEPTAVPIIRLGDVISLCTGIIYDHNRNPVPDGTSVRFLFNVISESSGSTSTQIDTETIDGVARYMYRIERPGLLEIHAVTDHGARTDLLRMDITTGVSYGVTQVAPTPMPTETRMPTPTITVTVTPTPEPTPLPPATVKFQDWFYVFMLVMVTALGVAWLGIRRAIARWGLRWALCGVIGGFLAYNYLALDLPGSEAFLRESGRSGVLWITLVGVLVGWIIGLIWRQIDPGTRMVKERPSRERPATGPKSQSS